MPLTKRLSTVNKLYAKFQLPSSATITTDSGLPGIHRVRTSPRKTPPGGRGEASTDDVATSPSGEGASEHNEDSTAAVSKNNVMPSLASKDGVSDAEMKALEDVSLSEEEERASSGSPQMIDCPAIESPAPSHTSQVSAGSGVEQEHQEAQDDDGREKHETEGEKEIPIDAALVTELSCDTIESSSMPLSPLLEKKVSCKKETN